MRRVLKAVQHVLGMPGEPSASERLAPSQGANATALFTLAACFLVTVAIGAIDYFDGHELTSYIFYCLPVFVASLRVGTAGGVVIALFAGIVWTVAAAAPPASRFHTQAGFLWAATVRELTFLFVVFCGRLLRAQGFTLVRLIRAEERADRVESGLLALVASERARLASEVMNLLIPQVESLRRLAKNASLLPAGTCNGDSKGDWAAVVLSDLSSLEDRMRDLSNGLSVGPTQDANLGGAVRRVAVCWARATGVEFEIRENAIVPMKSDELERLVSLIIDAVRLALKARARCVTVTIAVNGNICSVALEDDGVSAATTPQSSDWWLINLQATQMGIAATFSPVVPHGRQIRFQWEGRIEGKCQTLQESLSHDATAAQILEG